MKYLLALLMTLMFFGAAFATPCPKGEYQQELAAIGFKEPTSVAAAAEKLKVRAKGQLDSCKEELISLFRNYYLESLKKYNEAMDDKINDKNKEKLNKSLAQIGWTVKWTQGFYYLGETPNWFGQEFKDILTPAYQDYWQIRAKEIREGFSEDAALRISWEQLRNRIITWENFLKKYPDFVEKPGIQDYLGIYLATYLGGMDNSRIYEFNKMMLDNEVRASYEKFIKENQTSKYFPIVRDFYEMLKKNGFVVPDNYAEFLGKRNYKSLLGVEPPTY